MQPHQQRIADEAKQHAIRKLLLWQTGSGKTLGGLAGAESIGKPYTVVAPASLRQTWTKERNRFTDQQTPADIISYTQAAKGFPADKLDTLLTDESQRLNNPSALQTKQVQLMADRAKSLLVMSATPVTNRPSELAGVIGMLTGHKMTPAEFDSRFVDEKTIKPNIINRLRGITPGIDYGIKNEDELRNLLQGRVDYYSPEKPPVSTSREEYEVELSKPQAHIYKAIMGQLPFVLRWKLKHSYPLSKEEYARMQSFQVGLRMSSLSTLPFMRHKSPQRAFRDSPKLQLAYKNLTNALADPQAKALVFSNFIHAGLEPYSDALTRAGIPNALFSGKLNDASRKKLVDDFNNDRIRVALMGPSGSEGISFRGARIAQILDSSWQNARVRQQEGRGIRFDSHIDLPEELRHVTIQKYISKLPLGLKDRFLESIGFDRSQARRGSDDYLRALSAKKDALNEKFLNLLKDVGSHHDQPAQPYEQPQPQPQQPDRKSLLRRFLSLFRSSKQASNEASELLPYTAAGLTGILAYLALSKITQERRKPKPHQSPLDGYIMPYLAPEEARPTKQLFMPEEGSTMKLGALVGISPETAPSKPKPGILGKLEEIKKYSDNGNFDAKHFYLRELMDEHPFQWVVSEDPSQSKKFVGVQHYPTGWRFHMPRALVPVSVYEDNSNRVNSKPIVL